jgi:hypothetical protein
MLKQKRNKFKTLKNYIFVFFFFNLLGMIYSKKLFFFFRYKKKLLKFLIKISKANFEKKLGAKNVKIYWQTRLFTVLKKKVLFKVLKTKKFLIPVDNFYLQNHFFFFTKIKSLKTSQLNIPKFTRLFLNFRKRQVCFKPIVNFSFCLAGKFICLSKTLVICFSKLSHKLITLKYLNRRLRKKLLLKIFKIKFSKIYLLNIRVLKQKYLKDFLKQSYFLDKILRTFTKNGKKIHSELFLEQLANFCKQQLNCSVFSFFNLILQYCLITIELIPMKQAGRILFVPNLLPVLRQITFALKLLKKNSLIRNEQNFFLRFLTESLDIILYQKGFTLQKLAKINEIAFDSQPNLHFRWKKTLP